ncbi:MAG TPA: hypothetical protein DDX98_03855 [Bacteroidales bacterium]|jgi:ligand-binding sensor domain-containing protein|nr:hypothetical protein [Bacteroidales bacterium]
MKQFFSLLLVSTVFFMSCQKEDVEPTSSKNSDPGVSISKKNVAIESGESMDLDLTYSGFNRDISFSFESSNTAVATVSHDGNILAKAPGTADIFLKSADNTPIDTCKVSVFRWTLMEFSEEADFTAIYAIQNDKQNNIWFGGGGGLYKYDGHSLINYYTADNGFNSPWVTSILFDENDDIWVGTGSGIYFSDGSDWIIFNKYNSGLSDDDITCLAIDSEKNIWAGTDEGLCKFDGKIWHSYASSTGSLNKIRDIYIDEQDMLWAASEGGVATFDGVDWKKVSPPLGAYDGFRCIHKDNDNNIWAGTSLSGVHKYDGTEWKKTGQAHVLDNTDIHQIKADNNGTIWIAASNGLYRFNGTKWIRYSPHETNLALSLFIDSANNKWCGGYSEFFKLENE